MTDDFRLEPDAPEQEKPRRKVRPRRAVQYERCWDSGWVSTLERDSSGMPARLLVGPCPECGRRTP